jgi:hypothetical protein
MKVAYTLVLAILFSTKLFSLDIGVEIVSGKTSDKDIIYGIRNNIYFSKSLALQFKYENIKKSPEDQHRYTTNALYRVNNLYHSIIPYLSIGIGYEESEERSNFYNLGCGVKYHYTTNANLIFETNAIKKIEQKYDYNFIFGIGYDFFKKTTNQNKNIKESVNPKTIINLSKTKDENIFLTPY